MLMLTTMPALSLEQFSTFNGNYEKSDTLEGRPVYQEQRKFDRLPYDKDSDKIPAEITYNKDLKAWIFTHQNIVKKKGEKVSLIALHLSSYFC